MSAVTSWSRTAASNNSAPPDGAPEGWAPSAVNNVIREIMTAVVNEAVNNACKVLASVAGTNTITATATPDITAYSTGMLLFFTPANNNTGATTINVDSLGAKSIVKGDGSALVSGDLQASTIHLIVYDGTNFVLLNPVEPLARYDDATANFTGTLQIGGIDVGYKGIPSRAYATSANTLAADNGKLMLYDGAGGQTFTIDSDLPVDGVVTILNSGSGSLTIAESLSGSLFWFNGSGALSSGSRTLAVGGVATVFKIDSNNVYIWGTGLS